MNAIVSVIRKSAVPAICLGLILGCSIMVNPSKIPTVKGPGSVSLKGVSLIVLNAEKDASPYEIPNEKGQQLGIKANRQAWTGRLVEALSAELARRGAQLRSKAPLKISLAMPGIVFSMADNSYQFSVKVSVSSSKGWSKTYDAAARSGTSLFESSTSLTRRLAEQALADAVQSMVGDKEFLKHVGQQG